MATKYKVLMVYSDGSSEEQDEIFDDESSAEEYGQYCCGCCRQGREILHMSNPGDYPLNEDDDIDYEVIEVDD